MLCKGTAWNQVRLLDPDKLMDPETGVAYLLDSLSSWEETSELKTFELFEKAIYKVTQKADEAAHSYSLRLGTAFADLGDKVTIKEMQAFILLRQSALSNEDKKRVLTMASGGFTLKSIEQAMRTLSTKVLFSAGEPKKKIYPANMVETDENPNPTGGEDGSMQATYNVSTEEEEALTAEHIEQLAIYGDEDALMVQQFEKDFEDMMQEIPDLQQALVSYQEARQRISDRRRSRGFWPSKGKGKGFARSGGRKGGGKNGKDELLAKISRTHCKLCGMIGHWKAECPQKRDPAKEQANVVQPEAEDDPQRELPQVIFEPPMEDQHRRHESCFVVHSPARASEGCIRPSVQHAVLKFWSPRLNKYNLNRSRSHVSPNMMTATAMHRRTRKMPASSPSIAAETKHQKPVAECLTSQAHRTKQATGMAILDTGASRSVIGNDHVTAVLQKLPASVREQVRECPSKVGFRFGNNHIAYSFKQLQIPLFYKNQRIWLLIEVVPKATPFLLSIKTMKSLGANIDCKETHAISKHLIDLCRWEKIRMDFLSLTWPTCVSHQRHAPKQPFLRQVQLSVSHQALQVVATPFRMPSRQEVLEGLRVLSEEVLECLRILFAMIFSMTRAIHPDEQVTEQRGFADHPADPRSACSADQDLRAGESHPESTAESSDQPIPGTCTQEPKSCGDDWHGPVGARRNGRRSPKPWSFSRRNYEPSCKPLYFPTYGICDHDEQPSGSGSQVKWIQGSWNPITQLTSTTSGRSFQSGKQRQSPAGFDTERTGAMGPKEHHVGQETSREKFPRGVRHRSGIHPMGSSPIRQPARGRWRLSELRQHPPKIANNGTAERERLSEWQPIPFNRYQNRHRIGHEARISDGDEAGWLKEVFKIINKGGNKCSKLDLLEVYAYPKSNLTEVARQCGLKAERFTKEDGDLSTKAGRRNLLVTSLLRKPSHVWLSPECRPCCAWNRFNAQRSPAGFVKVQQDRQESRAHLKLCNLVYKIQAGEGRHTHFESPWSAETWYQRELTDFLRGSVAAKVDQCTMGLKNPQTKEPIEKKTRIQTTSMSLFKELDQRICHREHKHGHVAGTCKWMGKTINVSQFAAMYPRAFAKAIVKGILREKSTPIEAPILHVSSIEEPPTKRARIQEPHDNPEDNVATEAYETAINPQWHSVMEKLRQLLPKSGIKTWTNPADSVFQEVQAILPQYSIGAIRAGKGLDRYIVGDQGWVDDLPRRHTIVMLRSDHTIQDLGAEDCSRMSKLQAHRHAKPSHVMLSVFAEKNLRDQPVERPDEEMAADAPQGSNVRDDTSLGTVNPDLATWTPLSASVSGPKFLELSDGDKGIIRKLHTNLGHPTSEKLARHLSEARAQRHLIEAAKDYLCGTCAERQKPKLTTPGNLKDPKEFNERISFDGFEWKGKGGQNYYVIHVIDEATRFHLGLRSQRDIQTTIKTLHQIWFQWAGYPRQIAHDQGGEFMTNEWKDLLLEHGIQPILSAAPWQRGRIERHGSTIKDMLHRIDQEYTINDSSQFDAALLQCFQAKNAMSIVDGYSPEQAVLGRASRLPASIISDEDSIAHLNCQGADLASEKFQQRLELRASARAAFARADNNQAIRRAMLRQSRGTQHSWACGQLCMYWERRKSPNMLEKGRWNGPAQIVCQESRTIVWITHLNRLLRCAHENLRPVSMREFQQHATFTQISTSEQLSQMSQRLQQRFKERSGLFQYLDLSEVGPSPPNNEDPEADNLNNPSSNNSSGQPEEEPHRKFTINLDEDAVRLAHAQATPVPEPPVSSIPREDAEERTQAEESESATAEMETDVESAVTDPNMEPVYNAEILEQNSEEDIVIEDNGTLWTAQDPYEHACTTFAFDVPRQQLSRYLAQPSEYLPCLMAAAKKSRSEVKYSDLSSAEKKLFHEAKQKELKCWLDTQTVQAIMRNKIHPSRIMSSRWILTWKEDASQPSGRKAKARLVVKGFQDPDIGSLCSDSPTLTRDSRMLLLQTVSSMRWVVQSFDITTAFLRGRSDDRQLAMEAPPELQALLGIDSKQVCLLRGNANGRVDAPLLFYEEFKSRLEDVGFQTHPLDNCLFLLRNPTNPKILDGILGTHVDDGIGGGNSNFEKALEKLQKTLPFGSREHGRFKFTGLDIEQLPDHSIKISQGRYVHKIPPIDIPKTRRLEPDSSINPQEMHQLRGLCGSLQYAAVHSRPDIATRVAYLQKSIPKATVETLLEGNRTLKEAQKFSDTSIIVRSIPLSEVSFASFGDASFASARQLSAQQGLFIMACSPRLARNELRSFPQSFGILSR